MYGLDAITPILAYQNNAILYKKLTHDMLNMEKIIVSHSLVYIKSGTVKIETFDYKSYTASDGDMLFMPRDSYLISDYIKKEQSMEVYLFFFDHNITSEFLQNITLTQTPSTAKIMKVQPSQNIVHYIDGLKNTNYKDKENKHLLKTKLLELLHLLHEVNEDFVSVLQAQTHSKTDVQTYMLEHYDKNLTVNDWAALSGDSLSTFNRKFKKLYNLTPKQWMIKQKMALAKVSIEEGMSVTDCATEFGYKNSSNFIKAFKNIYKTTPKQL